MKVTALVTLSLAAALILLDFDPTTGIRLNNQMPQKVSSSNSIDSSASSTGSSSSSSSLDAASGIWPMPMTAHFWNYLPHSTSIKNGMAHDHEHGHGHERELAHTHTHQHDSSDPASHQDGEDHDHDHNHYGTEREGVKGHQNGGHEMSSFLHDPDNRMEMGMGFPSNEILGRRLAVLNEQFLSELAGEEEHEEDGQLNSQSSSFPHLFDHIDESDPDGILPSLSVLKRTSSSAPIGSRKTEDRKRANRPYDVPQIECPPADDGMERFACPSPDRQGRYRCIDDHVLCDGFVDCPKEEDEDRHACMFYKTTKAHLDVLADALLRWARGRR